ncbi:MAG: hypothetical protein KAX36_07230 [Thermoflexales bacterium]|nr:hypothetical protein [Thermoflexales bacterium]
MTADESAAMEAMKADTGPEIAPAEAVDVPETPAETPAPVAETPAPEADKPPPGMVPQGALHQERERRKASEAAFQELQAKLAAIEAKLNPPPEIVVPDPVLQPEAFKQFQIDQIKQRAAEKAEIDRRAQEQAQEAQIMARVNQDVMQFKAATPDYDQAFQHAVKVRREELAFYGNSPEQIDQQIEVDVRAIVGQAYSQGKNPGELFYGYAKMRGYSPAQAARDPVPAQAAAQVNALAEAQRQTQSMATAGGPSSDGGVTIETLAKMSEAQLAKMPKAERDAMMQKVMGG